MLWVGAALGKLCVLGVRKQHAAMVGGGGDLLCVSPAAQGENRPL